MSAPYSATAFAALTFALLALAHCVFGVSTACDLRDQMRLGVECVQ